MKIITNNEQLTALIPNTLISVKGEMPLFDKLAPFLDLAEAWVKETFTSESTYNTICGYTDSNPIRIATARLVVADAMRRAIPSLDLVLTPNGFATVGTQNLVAASKMRVDRLVGSMQTHRDDCIAALLPELPGASRWLNSDQAAFFGATLFPTFEIVNQCPVSNSQSLNWERYLELRPQIIDLEASLAEEWLSPELMSALRAENLRGDLPPPPPRCSPPNQGAAHRLPAKRLVQQPTPRRYCQHHPQPPRPLPRMAQLRHRPIVHAPGVPQPQRSLRLLLLSIPVADLCHHASDA